MEIIPIIVAIHNDKTLNIVGREEGVMLLRFRMHLRKKEVYPCIMTSSSFNINLSLTKFWCCDVLQLMELAYSSKSCTKGRIWFHIR